MGKRKRYSNFNCGCFLGILILGLLFAAPYLVRVYVDSHIRSAVPPQVYKEVINFFEEPVELPKDWQTVSPYSEELLTAQKKFDDELSQWTGQEEALKHPEVFEKLNAAIEITSDDWLEAIPKIKQTESLLQRIVEFVNCDDYQLQAWPESDPNSILTNPNAAIKNTLMLQLAARIFVVRSFHFASEGRWEEAFNSSMMVLRMACRHPTGQIITHQLAVACEMIALKYQSRMVAECEDSKLLRNALEEMNSLDKSINHTTDLNVYLLDVVGGLRHHIRKGVEIDLSVNEPPAYFFELLSRYGFPWVPQIPKTGFAKVGDSLRQPHSPIMRLLGFNRILLAVAIPNVMETQIRQQSAHAQFDLTRLILVHRILELEGGQKISNTEEIVPAFIEGELIDPFSEKTYLWDATNEAFYSVAPNKIDEGNAIRYSPTNGTTSAGDLSLP